MKRIIIVHSNMEIGGAETSLLGLLKSFDYTKYSIDLLLLNPIGELMQQIPKEVNLLPTPKEYRALTIPIKEAIKNKEISIASGRVLAKIITEYNRRFKRKTTVGYMTKEFSHRFCSIFLPKIKEEYDLGISFIDPHYIIQKKVNAKVKMGWLHTDFNRVSINEKIDFKMWNNCDYIVSVSDSCKEAFDKRYPQLKNKSIVIENILPLEFVKYQSEKQICDDRVERNSKIIKICSIGRFSDQKNFDNVPNIAKKLVEKGVDIKWYLIGYGNEEDKIRKNIIREGMDKVVIILGKKENPYPYINNCDLYVQPSRYEGKAVTVREAQMLNKPVIITNFATAKSQLEDKIDGIIVPMDNENCANEIISLINNKELQKVLINNTKMRDYSNKGEIQKLYNLI